MTTFIKAKHKISDDQTYIDKFSAAANIIEYHIVSKIVIPKFKIIKKLFYVKNVFKNDF